jgi:hypothetical protein
MTVSTTTNQSGPFTCNGTVKAFDYTFQVDQTADIVATLTNSTTGVNTIVNPSLYTVAIVGTGGTVTFTTAPVTGQTLTIGRSTTQTQLINLENLGTLQPTVLESGYDKLTMMVQDSGATSDRAIVVPATDAVTLNKELPVSSLRANKLFGFDASGQPEATTGRVLSGSGSGSSLAPGSAPTVVVTFSASSGNLDIAIGVPTGATGATGTAGQNGIFSEIASKSEAETGTDNVKGMSPLRVKEAITFNASNVSNAAFYGFKKTSGVLQVDQSTAGGSEAFTLTDYDDSQFASFGLTFSLTAAGHLLVTTP